MLFPRGNIMAARRRRLSVGHTHDDGAKEDITIMHRCRSRSVCRTSMSILVECRRHRSESVVVSSNSNSYPTIPYLIVVSRNNQQLHPHKNHQNDIKPWLLEAAATPLRLLRYLRCRGSARLVSLCSSTHILIDTCYCIMMAAAAAAAVAVAVAAHVNVNCVGVGVMSDPFTAIRGTTLASWQSRCGKRLIAMG